MPKLSELRDRGLISHEQCAELERWLRAAPPGSKPNAAAELVRRGWLTPFQAAECAAGRADGLAFGPYLLLELLGEGGTGRVYKAVQPRLGRHLAVKVLRPDRLNRPQAVERFCREVRAVARLRHPNVAAAIDADTSAGRLYLAMEYVEGSDLGKMVTAHGPVPTPLACEYVRQAALGLQHAADQGLVHRDVKPSNLLLTPRGQVKVTDFGLAMLADDGGAHLTRDENVAGTPDFVAPEQARSARTVDARADVYSLGATLYFLLTGRPPFDGGTPREKLLRHATEPPPSARLLRPEVPPALDALIQGMMAKRPEDRPVTPGHAAQLLAPFAHGAAPPAPQPPSPAEQDAQFWADAAQSAPRRRGPATKTYRRASERTWSRPVLLGAVLIGGLAAAVALSAVLFPAAAPPPGERFDNPLGATMVRLDGGTFTMGSGEDEPGRSPDELPPREVTVSGPFYVSATEVTHGEYVKLMGKAPSVTAKKARSPERCPVDNVPWAAAVEFCRKLSELPPVRRGWAYRLPTEAEWEYACRAGTNSAFGVGERLKCGADAVFTFAETDGLGEPADGAAPPAVTRPVGTTRPNAWGLFDLHGNVWEWCQESTVPNGGLRAARGGAYDCPASRCRSASRAGVPPEFDAPRGDVGFRVVYAPTTAP